MRLRKRDVVMCVDATSPLGLLEEAEVYEVTEAYSHSDHVELRGGAFASGSRLSWMARRFVRVGSVR